MIDESIAATDPRMQAAIAELRETIHNHYPEATFRVGPIGDMPGIWLTATVDLDDPDEVVNLVIDRVVEMQDVEGLPLHVLPHRTPERIVAMLRAERERSMWLSLTSVEAVG